MEHSSSVEFSTPMGRRITVAAGYKCLWWPYVMTIAFAARHEITRYSVIQSVMVIYHLVDDAISSPPLPSPSLSSPRGLSRVHCPVHWPRAARLIEIRCRDSSWRNLLLENISSARISRLLIFNKAESSESSKSEESDFNARLLWPIRVETIEGEKRLLRRVSGGEGGEFE